MSLIDGLTRITVAPDQRYSDYTRGEADIMGAYSFKVSLRYIIFTIQINAHIFSNAYTFLTPLPDGI